MKYLFKDLAVALQDNIKGSFFEILKALLYSPAANDCHELYRAIKGIGTDEQTLFEILTSRSYIHLQAINDLYPKCNDIFTQLFINFSLLLVVFKQSFEQDIANFTNAHMKRILIALTQSQRPESNEINEYQIENDAKKIYEAGENKWTTDTSKFIQIVCNRRFTILIINLT